MTKIKKNKIDDAEYGVDSRYKSDEESKSSAIALMESRLIRMKNLSKEVKELFEYPNDIPSGLDKERLYASGENSYPGERLRNFLSPFYTYFEILEDNKIPKEMKDNILEGITKECIKSLPYIKYWVNKIE